MIQLILVYFTLIQLVAPLPWTVAARGVAHRTLKFEPGFS